MKKYWLGIDCGGTYLKAGLYDHVGNEIGIYRIASQIETPNPGWAERDMHQLWQSCIEVIAALLKKHPDSSQYIQGIGISAQGKGLFLLDNNDKPLGKGILSSDRRAMDIVLQWREQQIPEQLYPLTKQTLWTGHPVSLLRWIKDNQPERYQQIGSVMMSHDYLRFCLTGNKGCEITNISESNLYNMQTKQYDIKLAELLGIGDIINKLPPIVGSSDICGYITPEVAKLTGLTAGTPVIGGLFDVVSTAICSGLKDETMLNVVMGTWAVTSGIANQLRDNEPYPYVYGEYATANQYIVHEASPTSSANLEWVIKQFGQLDFQDINQRIEQLPKAASEVFFIPFLYGTNSGLAMTSGFYGMQSSHSQDHLLQAVYEGVIFSHMIHINRMLQRFTQIRTLRVTGGPTKSKVWMQMLADISGYPLELTQIEETGCFGAALTAMIGTQQYQNYQQAETQLKTATTTIVPNKQIYQAYQQKFKKYQNLIEALNQFHLKNEHDKKSGEISHG